MSPSKQTAGGATAGRPPRWAARGRVVPVQRRIDRLPALFGDWGSRILERAHAQSSVSARRMIGVCSTTAVPRYLFNDCGSTIAVEVSFFRLSCPTIAVQRSLFVYSWSTIADYQWVFSCRCLTSQFNHRCLTIAVQQSVLNGRLCNHWLLNNRSSTIDSQPLVRSNICA